MTSEKRIGGGRHATYGLLFFAAVAIATTFLSGDAYGQATTSNQDTTNTADGSATAASGSSSASGNNAGTSAAQAGTGSANVVISNTGSANANSGGNSVKGNDIANNVAVDNDATTNPDNRWVLPNQATGTARATTGSASATGNQSATTVTQAGERLGGAVNQSVVVTNDGDATAISGDNLVIGNDVNNLLPVTQLASGRRTTITNRQSVLNRLEGSARVATGDADATGNRSTTDVNQIATTVAPAAGGTASINQHAAVTNRGDALAVSGRNIAIGNDVDNRMPVIQDVLARGPPRPRRIVFINRQTVRNILDGRASITTGNGAAVGNDSTTAVSQTAIADGYSDASITQNADVANLGDGKAISGDNTAIGNDVVNDMPVEQAHIRDEVNGFRVRVRIDAQNRQTVVNDLVGRARIDTGDITNVVGNTATTSIAQEAWASDNATITQNADVRNEGEAAGISGENVAMGNRILNRMPVTQGVHVTGARRGRARVRVDADNRQNVANRAVGSARITTGDVNGVGITGRNTAIGNEVVNRMPVAQGVLVTGVRVLRLRARVQADNRQHVTNQLDGRARIDTGDAAGHVTHAITSISQVAAAGGSATVTQDAQVTNRGAAKAVSGENTAVGNRVRNLMPVIQGVGIVDGRNVRSRVRLDADNRQQVINRLDGSAAVSTGDVDASGLDSITSIDQQAHAHGTDSVTQRANADNVGEADAVSGDNIVVGNAITNRFPVDMTVPGGRRNRVDLFNRQNAVNRLEGHARLSTGAASASGGTIVVGIQQIHGSDFDAHRNHLGHAKKHGDKDRAHRGGGRKAGTSFGHGDGELAFTGAGLAAQMLFGLVLIVLGAMLRRARTITS